MIKYFFIPLLMIVEFGCSGSLIKIKTVPDLQTYPMYGRTPEKDFVIPQTIGDTLIKKWENDINGGFSFSSVTAYGGYIFVSDLSGRIYCFNDTSGKVAGKLKYKGSIFSAPVIDQTNIIFALASENNNVSNLISYDFITGKENFDNEIKGRILNEIIKADDALIFNTEEGDLYKYTIDGKEKWKAETKTFIHSSPALSGGLIFFGNDKGEINAFNFNNGKLIYKKKIGESFFGGASIRDGVAFIGNDNGKLYTVELNSGKIKWEFKSSGRITMVPIIKDDFIIFGNLNGDLYKIRKSDGSQIWKTKTEGLLNATPLLTNNAIVVPDYNRKFYLVDPSVGGIFKTIELDGRLKLSPVIVDNTLFIGYENGNICAYKY